MSLDTASEATSDTVSVATQDSTPVKETKPSSAYSVTDPGYETMEPVEDELAALKAENTKSKPSETSDDASDTESETDSDTEETAETPAEGSAESLEDISDELLDRAIAVGYDLEDIRDFKDAKSFEKELARVERLQQRLQSKKAGTEEPAPKTEPESEQKEPDWDQLIEDGHDPDIIALQKSSWQRAAAAEAEVRLLRQAEQLRMAEARSDRFDEALNGLGDEYEPILGKGVRKTLSKDAVANRQKVFTKMDVLRRGYELSGEPVPSEPELIQEAVQASFYKQAQEIARNSIKKQIKNAGSQALSRPRSGSAKDLPGPERALRKEQEFWKQHGG